MYLYLRRNLCTCFLLLLLWDTSFPDASRPQPNLWLILFLCFLYLPVATRLAYSRVSEFVLDEACQVFGGRAISRTGMGQVVERFMRGTKFGAILGGSEEIMADLGMRQAMKNFPLNARL